MPPPHLTAELPLGPTSGHRNAEFVCRRRIHQTVVNLSFIPPEKVETCFYIFTGSSDRGGGVDPPITLTPDPHFPCSVVVYTRRSDEGGRSGADRDSLVYTSTPLHELNMKTTP